MNKLSKINFSKHKITVIKNDESIIYKLYHPGTNTNNIIFINTYGTLSIIGSFGNWIFNQEFHPKLNGDMSKETNFKTKNIICYSENDKGIEIIYDAFNMMCQKISNAQVIDNRQTCGFKIFASYHRLEKIITFTDGYNIKNNCIESNKSLRECNDILKAITSISGYIFVVEKEINKLCCYYFYTQKRNFSKLKYSEIDTNINSFKCFEDRKIFFNDPDMNESWKWVSIYSFFKETFKDN